MFEGHAQHGIISDSGGSNNGRTTYAALEPGDEILPTESPEAVPLLKVLEKGKEFTMAEALAAAEMPHGATLFRRLMSEGKLVRRRDYKRPGVTVFHRPDA